MTANPSSGAISAAPPGAAVGASAARLNGMPDAADPETAVEATTKDCILDAADPETVPEPSTKDRILDAALATIANDGLMGATARRIAAAGDFNQALIFYHFGSIEELLLASLERANRRRMARFADRLNEVKSLTELVRLASALHGGPDDPDSPALAAIVTGWSNTEEFGARILATMEPWDSMVEAAIRRSLEGTAFAGMVPAKELSWAVSALYLGIEMLSRLDPADRRSAQLFGTLGGLAMIADPILQSGLPLGSDRPAT